jgi:uncharacterized membrane protein
VNAPPIAQNVETIASLRDRAEEDLSAHQRGIEWITAALGQPRSIYVIVLLVAGWVALNVGASRIGLSPPDPLPCSDLQGFIGLTALLMTTMVLTTQNRQSKHAEQRAHLDLQVNLLAEQKVAKLIALVEELRRDIPIVRDRVDLVAEGMTEPLDPEAVLTALEETFERSAPTETSGLTDSRPPHSAKREKPRSRD